jgi:outer membrane protein
MEKNIRVHIYDGKRKSYRFNEIDARIDSIKTIIRDTQNRVKNDVRKTFSDMESGFQNIKAANSNYNLSSESYKIAKIQYEAGASTNLDLLDAESKLTRSKFTLVQSEYKHLLGCLSLLHAAGRDLSDTTALLSIGTH